LELGSLKIREASFKDLFRVVKIERENFSKPWGLGGFVSELVKRDSIFLVVEFEDNVIGYVVTWISFDEAYIANIAVDLNYQGIGVGSRLIDYLLNILKEKGIRRVILEVRLSNFVARRLYEKFGFKVVGIRKNMYHDGEDGLVMEVRFENIVTIKEVCDDGTRDYRETLKEQRGI